MKNDVTLDELVRILARRKVDLSEQRERLHKVEEEFYFLQDIVAALDRLESSAREWVHKTAIAQYEIDGAIQQHPAVGVYAVEQPAQSHSRVVIQQNLDEYLEE